MQIYLHWQPPPLHTHSLALSLSFRTSPSPYCIVSDWFSGHLRWFPFSFSLKYLDRKEVAAEAELTISYPACNVIVSFPHFRGLKLPRKGMQRSWQGRGERSRGSCGQGQGLPPDVPAFLGSHAKGAAGGNIGKQKPRLNDHFLYLTWQQTLSA